MKRKKTFWIFLIIVIAFVATGIGYHVVTRLDDGKNPPPSSGEASTQTAIARVGDLTIVATGSGQIIPATETALSFKESGVIVDLLVKVGDDVEAGDIIARLQTDKTPTQLTADIAGAELALIRAQHALDDLVEAAEIESAEALRAVESAQLAFEALIDVELEQALALQSIAEAKAAVEDAEMIVYITNSSPLQDAIYTAYASTLFKEKELNRILDQIETTRYKIKSAKDDIIRDRLKMELLRLNAQFAEQKIDYENAVYKYNSMDDPADPLELEVAEAQLTTALAQLVDAQQEWEDIQGGPATDEIVLAEAKLAEAQAEWELLKDGPNPEEIALAEAELATAQARLALIQQEQLVVELVAPTEGTVLSINADVGEYVKNGTILTLADLSQTILEVYLDEMDLDKISQGYEVEVVFDALPDDIFKGHVVAVDPGLVEVSRVPAVQALVRLDTTSYAKLQNLPVGLNAAVDVIAGQSTNAVLVPVDALFELGTEEYAVYISKNDTYVLQMVSVGLMDYANAEILDGLTAGDIVAIGYIETTGNEP